MRIEHGVNENPSFIPTCFGTQQKVRKWQKVHFTFLLVDIITFKTFQIIFLLNTNIPYLLSTVFPMQSTQTAVWIAIAAPVYVYLIVVSSNNTFSQLHWQN